MNASVRPAWLVRPGGSPQPPARPAADASQTAASTSETHLWHSRFGTIVVEVRDGQVYVNGQWVRPAETEG